MTINIFKLLIYLNLFILLQKRWLLLLLEYPLLMIPLSLAHHDGSRKTCAKTQTYRNNNKKICYYIDHPSIQMEHRKIYYRPYGYTENFHLYRWNIRKYIIDLMATLRTFIYTDGTSENIL